MEGSDRKAISTRTTFPASRGSGPRLSLSILHNEIGPLLIQPLSDELGSIPDNQKALVSRSVVVVMSGENARETMDASNQLSRSSTEIMTLNTRVPRTKNR